MQGAPRAVGDAMGALLCRPYFGVENSLLREIIDDLPKHEKRRLAPTLRIEIPVKHAAFLCGIC